MGAIPPVRPNKREKSGEEGGEQEQAKKNGVTMGRKTQVPPPLARTESALGRCSEEMQFFHSGKSSSVNRRQIDLYEKGHQP